MRDVQHLRVRSLKALINQWGGPTSLSKKLKLSGSYVAQLVGGHRPITEKTARRFEQQLGLETGWMDQEHETTVRAARIDDTMLARTITLVTAVVSEAGVTVPPDKMGELVSWVYSDASARGAPDEQLVRRIVGILK